MLAPITAAASLLAASLVAAVPHDKRAGCTIASIGDVAGAKGCATITINSFTVPAKTQFDLTGLAAGATVNLMGDVTFTGKTPWDGPMFAISGSNIKFNGNGHTFDGQGKTYWDTFGSNKGGSQKPGFLRITMDGTFRDLNVLNSPRQVFSLGSTQTLVVSGVKIDNSAGDALASNGKPLAHNTDCFDVSGSHITISGSTCINQDDCLAINNANDITFSGNTCQGGHGISIGSVASGKVVSNVKILNNKVLSSDNGLRIKTIEGATGGSVSGITYTGNTVTGASKFGVVIAQDYNNGGSSGTPTNGISISDIIFSGTNTVSVASGAQQVSVLCGVGSCKGNWDWSGLKTSGGSPGHVKPANVPITGYTKPASDTE